MNFKNQDEFSEKNLKPNKKKKNQYEDDLNLNSLEAKEQNDSISRKIETVNKDIVNIMYIFVGLFVILLGYFSYFILAESPEVINNPYNKRQELLVAKTVRGNILSADGEVLATTKVDENNNETRYYPYGDMFAHVVGRVLKGKTGIESSESFTMLTSNTNGIKKIFNELTGKKNNGDNIVTTLDTRLQEVAYNALGDHRGAVVVMEPSSGKILAMVSKPDYDPNEISENWDELVEDDENNSSLINRATQGLYPPGSTFKILTTLEYIRENPNYEDYQYDCKGTGVFNSVTINCYNHKVHGDLDLQGSFAKSCNTSFANIGTTLNQNKFRKLCKTFLFNSPLPTDMAYNKSSFVITSKSDKSKMPQTSIGQGDTQITPLHNALITAAVANGGAMMTPYVIDHTENENGEVVNKIMPEIYNTVMTPEEAAVLTQYMTDVVDSGTATELSGKKYTVAGKTGSAEYQEDKPAHAWFVGFSNVENPDIVVSIVVESVGTGSDYAVPIAAKIFDEYYK